jgi:uncharacterized protein with NRDE domain
MCLLVLAWEAHPRYRLVAAANRDEHHRRPTAAAAVWPEHPGLVAGRDLEAGGTWLGVTAGGRFAALTNFREPGRHRADAPSRGELVAAFLAAAEPPRQHLARLAPQADRYNGFSLVVGDPNELWYLSNRGAGPVRVAPGAHGLANHLLDTPWPKVVRSRERLAALLEADDLHPERLLELLSDREPPPDGELPDTGVGLELERLLAPPCVVGPGYGTRSSTAVLVGRDGAALLLERTLDAAGREASRRELRLQPGGEGFQQL